MFIIEFCFHVPILDLLLFVDHCTCVLDVTRTVWFYILFSFIQSCDIIYSYNKVIKVYTLLIVYLGVAEGDWKQRFYNHKKSIKNKSYRNDTTLSSYLWDLREIHNLFPTLTWSIVKSMLGYSNISKICLLCLAEKVLTANPKEMLKKRSELMTKCRHNNKFLLSNYKSND